MADDFTAKYTKDPDFEQKGTKIDGSLSSGESFLSCHSVSKRVRSVSAGWTADVGRDRRCQRSNGRDVHERGPACAVTFYGETIFRGAEGHLLTAHEEDRRAFR
jgi:hypothetical protein